MITAYEKWACAACVALHKVTIALELFTMVMVCNTDRNNHTSTSDTPLRQIIKTNLNVIAKIFLESVIIYS